MSFTSVGIKKYPYVLIQLTLKVLLLLAFLLLYKKFHFHILLKKYNPKIIVGFITYLLSMTLFISYTAHHCKVFDRFILGVLGFLVIQVLFVLFLFIQTIIRQKEQYEQQLKEQDLVNLKRYTDQLEQEQERL
ncbi:ATP-binding protein, partial [Enterococcus faecalis]|nr:ATP-binding protein [Enterococcus faecalis]